MISLKWMLSTKERLVKERPTLISRCDISTKLNERPTLISRCDISTKLNERPTLISCCDINTKQNERPTLISRCDMDWRGKENLYSKGRYSKGSSNLEILKSQPKKAKEKDRNLKPGYTTYKVP